MRGAPERLKEEVRKLLGAAAFFAAAFCLIVLTEKLQVRGSHIETASFARAIVGGLIVAKVLLVVDLLPFVDAFADKPLVYNIVWKTPLYVAASLVFRYVEPLVKSLFGGASAAAAHHDAMQRFTRPTFWATEIWIALLFVVFLATQELTRAVGKDKMRMIFFGR